MNCKKGACTNFKTNVEMLRHLAEIGEIEASGRGIGQVSVGRKRKSRSCVVVIALIKTYHNREFTTQR